MNPYCPRCGEDGEPLVCEKCGAGFCSDCCRPREAESGLCKTCLTASDVAAEETASGEVFVVEASTQRRREPAFSPEHVHRYIDMQRRMILAKFEADSYKLRLQGPRIGILIKLTREATGLNQEQLAKRCGVDPTYLSKLANEKEEAGFPFLEALYFEWEKTQSYERLPQKQRLSNEYTPSGDEATETARPVVDPNSPLPADAPSADKVTAEKKSLSRKSG